MKSHGAMMFSRGFRFTSVWRNVAFSIALACLSAAGAEAQNNTVYSGSYSESGTRTDCNTSGTATPWSQSGTLTITVAPALNTLVTAGGPVSGTFTFSGTDMGCTTQAVSGQGSVAGVVIAGGAVTLVLTYPAASGCSTTAQGSISEVSATFPQVCLDHPGTGSFDVSSRSSTSSSSPAPTCIPFPTGFIPFSSISYVTAANAAGDHLVVGVPAPGTFSTIENIPLPAFTNQGFCDPQVQLAPQQFYPSVYVPTADESGGNFAAFAPRRRGDARKSEQSGNRRQPGGHLLRGIGRGGSGDHGGRARFKHDIVADDGDRVGDLRQRDGAGGIRGTDAGRGRFIPDQHDDPGGSADGEPGTGDDLGKWSE